MTVLYGGAFDPPHLGHVAVADGARRSLGVPRLLVLVSEQPEHRAVHASPAFRLELARAAFPADDVRLDPHPRTVDLLRSEQLSEPVFVVGADEFAGFLSWKEPEQVLALARVAVATRPGFPQAVLDDVLARLGRSDRVLFFEIDPNPAAARDVRALAAAGESLDGLVPSAVAELLRARNPYREDRRP